MKPFLVAVVAAAAIAIGAYFVLERLQTPSSGAYTTQGARP
jgi:hypothetical protein